MRELFKKLLRPGDESVITRRFALTVAGIYAVLIVAMAAAFNVVVSRNTAILRDTLMANNEGTLLDRVEIPVEQFRYSGVNSLNELVRAIEINCTPERDFLYALVFSRTEDENYFRVAGKIPIKRHFTVDIEDRAIVKEKKEVNYLKKALFHGIVEPVMYRDRNFYWQNVYYPYKIGKRTYVIQFMVNAAPTQVAVNNYSRSVRRVRLAISILSLFLVLAVVAVTVVVTQNYSLLIRNLSRYMKRAAEGDFEVNLNITADPELGDLAQSFTVLVEERKDRSPRESEEDLFKTGVFLLKENRLDESISVFRTLILVMPESFGSVFNLAVAYAKTGNYPESLAMFQKAREMNPEDELTGKYIGKVQRLMGGNGS